MHFNFENSKKLFAKNLNKPEKTPTNPKKPQQTPTE